VAGVVNFILKRDFSGAELSTQYGLTEQGDGRVMNADFVIGGNFEEGRGNAAVYASWTDRDAVLKGAREFSAQATNSTSYFPSGQYFGGANQPSQAAVDALFAGYGATGPVSASEGFGFNLDGTLYNVNSAANPMSPVSLGTVQNFRDPVDIDVAQRFFPDFYSYNFEPLNKLVMPLERTSLGGMARFDVGNSTEAYAHVFFTNYNAESALAPSPAPTSTNVTNPAVGSFFTIPVTNPFIPADLRTLLASRTGDSTALPGAGPNEDFVFRTRFLSLGPRVEAYENDVYQGMVGVRGTLKNDWTWDLYGASGRYNNQTNQLGNARVSAVEALLDAPDGGASLCEGGLNLFGNHSLSPECQAFIGVIAKNTERLEQNIAEITLSGDLFALPAGEVGFAVGGFYHKQDYSFLTDSVLASGDVSGFNAQDAVIGKVDNRDAFVEMLLPLLKEIPAVDSLNLALGYRFSDHSTAGSNSSYKGEIDWGIVEALRFRGTYQRAVRAPNIGELFQPLQEDNPEVDDPCNAGSAFRTGPDGAAVTALCVAQGMPSLNYSQATAQIDALAGGNPVLQEEQADTYTAGLVWQPVFSSPLFERFSASVDYYDIEVKDAINAISADVIANRCYNEDGANPTLDINNLYCQLFTRDSIGQIQDLLQNQQNLSVLNVSGVDLQIDWRFPLGERFGDLGFNWMLSYLAGWEQQIAEGDVFKDYAGTIGDDIGDYLPELKSTMTTRWSFRAFDTAVRLRYLDSAINEAVIDTGDADAGTGVPSTWYVDLSSSWQVSDAFRLRLGVENLLDQEIRMYAPNVQAATDPSVYDVLGRKYFLLANYTFGN
jgi:outer membrane receptor protein involved in Fe transport